MTAAPPYWPRRLLTVAEYLELGETDVRSELVEGQLLMSPSPTPDHGFALGELFVAIRAALPDGLTALQEIDLDLSLVPGDKPGTVRRPDLMVVHSDARSRVRRQGGLLVAADATLVVEIISPGTIRTDRLVKRGEYADAGIPHYWIVDLTEPVSILTCHLAGVFGYADGGEFTGLFEVADPFPFSLDLTTLL